MSRLLSCSLGLLLWAGAAGAAPGDAVHGWPRRTASETPPNIVVIMTDDLDLSGVTGMSKVQDLIAEKGITFTNAFVATPSCCPSRASTLRGQYAHNTGVRTSIEPAGGFAKFARSGLDTTTIANWLHDAGYHTGLIGKYLTGYDIADTLYVGPGWDEWVATCDKHYYGYPLAVNGTAIRYGNTVPEYETDVLASYAYDFVRRNAGAPFFLYVAPYAPHSPATPANRHMDTHLGLRAPKGESFNEGDVSDKPAWVQAIPPLDSAGIMSLDTLYVKRQQTLDAVDEMVDSLVSVLTEVGVLENTYVVFTSDNGYHGGQHRLRPGKATAYDEDIRVPLLVRGPGVPENEQRDHFVSNIDLAPTLAAWGGVSPPAFVDGLSLASILTSAPPTLDTWRSALLVEFWQDTLATSEDGSGFASPTFSAVRTLDHMFVHYITLETELYDMHADPSQMSNIAAIADSALVDSLNALRIAMRGCAAGECSQVSVEDGPVPGPLAAVSVVPTIARGHRVAIVLRLRDAAEVSVRLLDVTGRAVRTPAASQARAGENVLTLDVRDLASGVYLAEVRAGDATVRRRVCVMR